VISDYRYYLTDPFTGSKDKPGAWKVFVGLDASTDTTDPECSVEGEEMSNSTGKHGVTNSQKVEESSSRFPTADSNVGQRAQEDLLDAAVPNQTVATDEAVLEEGEARIAEAGPGTASAVSETAGAVIGAAAAVSGTAASEPGTASAEPATADQSAAVKGDQGRNCMYNFFILYIYTAWSNNVLSKKLRTFS
jgi:hypothetical protein